MSPDRGEIRAARPGRLRRSILVGGAMVGLGAGLTSAICGSGEEKNTSTPEPVTRTPISTVETMPSLTAAAETPTVVDTPVAVPTSTETVNTLEQRFQEIVNKVSAGRLVGGKSYWEVLGSDTHEFRPKVELINDYNQPYLYVIDSNFGVFLEKVDRETGQITQEVRDGNDLFGSVFEGGIVRAEDGQKFVGFLLAQDLNKSTEAPQTILGVIEDLDTSTLRVSVLNRDFEHCGPTEASYLEFTAVVGLGEEGIAIAEQRNMGPINDGICNPEDER